MGAVLKKHHLLQQKKTCTAFGGRFSTVFKFDGYYRERHHLQHTQRKLHRLWVEIFYRVKIRGVLF
jgi:hypothetical protein